MILPERDAGGVGDLLLRHAEFLTAIHQRCVVRIDGTELITSSFCWILRRKRKIVVVVHGIPRIYDQLVVVIEKLYVQLGVMSI